MQARLNLKKKYQLTPTELNTVIYQRVSALGFWCDLFLMSSETDTVKISDKNHLYLYKDNEGKIYYKIQDKDENQYLHEEDIKKALKDATFDQRPENPHKYTKLPKNPLKGTKNDVDIDIDIIVLNETLKRGHTLGHGPKTFSTDGTLKFHLVILKDKKFIICPMSKDAESADNERELPFYEEVLRQFRLYHKDETYILLMPVRQCRGIFKLPTGIPGAKKHHSVFWYYDLEKMSVPQQFDSMGSLSNLIYPNKRKEKNPSDWGNVQDKMLDKQHDSYSCGYYVAEYILWAIEHESTHGLETIQLNIASDYSDKNDYLAKHNALIDRSIYEQPIKYPTSAEEFLDKDRVIDSIDNKLRKGWVKIEESEDIVETWDIQDGDISIGEKATEQNLPMRKSSSAYSLFRSFSFSELTAVEDADPAQKVKRLSCSSE